MKFIFEGFLFFVSLLILNPLAVAADQRIEVFKYSGAIQCQTGSGFSLADMKKQLTNAGVVVLNARRGSDGKMYAAVCGGQTGIINIYTIYLKDLNTVKGLGYMQRN